MIVAGIDPGLDGALALHDGSAVVALLDMPTFAIVRGKTKRRDLDGQTICTWLREHHPAHAYIEQAQCILVIIGATPEGRKELVGFYRWHARELTIVA